MENGPFVGELPIQIVIFHSYVKLPEGSGYENQSHLRWFFVLGLQSPRSFTCCTLRVLKTKLFAMEHPHVFQENHYLTFVVDLFSGKRLHKSSFLIGRLTRHAHFP